MGSRSLGTGGRNEQRRLSKPGRLTWLAVFVVLAGVLVYSGFVAAQVAVSMLRARNLLATAESQLASRQVHPAEATLVRVEAQFQSASRWIDRLGPIGVIGRHVPVLRRQIEATTVLDHSGSAISRAGLVALHGLDSSTSAAASGGMGAALDRLPSTLPAIRQADRVIASVDTDVQRLKNYRLVWPINSARDQLVRRASRARTDLDQAVDGLSALEAFAGIDGHPRTYLILSQDSNEIRPTGGNLGSFTLMDLRRGNAQVSRFEDMGQWASSHPGDVRSDPPWPIAVTSGPSPVWSPVLANWSPDFPTSARQFLDFWQRAGEPPVDGVIGVTPEFLVRVLGVTGPLDVPGYGTVTASTLLPKAYSFVELNPVAGTGPGGRKSFLAELSHQALSSAVSLPPSRLLDLAAAFAGGFDAREAMAYDPDPRVGSVLGTHRWDNALVSYPGDYTMEVEANMTASKNNHLLTRAFRRAVNLSPDGSAQVTLAIHLSLGGPANDLNPYYRAFVRVLAPAGSRLVGSSENDWLAEGAQDGLVAFENWDRVGAGGADTLLLQYREPGAALVQGRRLQYRMYWQKQPGTSADASSETVSLPLGYRWVRPPPSDRRLSGDLHGEWWAQASA